MCEHGKEKRLCHAFGGSSMCEHGKQRHSCAECNECLCIIEGCLHYGHRFAGAKSLIGHMRSLHSGDRKALTKSKELDLSQALQAAGIQFEYQKYIPFAGCGLNSETRHAFADFVIASPWGYTILECDEDQHRAYPPECDVRRDFDIAASVALGTQHELKIIHYNPDEFRVDGKTRLTSKKSRLERLIQVLAEEPDGFERLFLFYDGTSDSHLPQVAVSWAPAACEVPRVV